MAWKIELAAEAEAELESAVAWYSNRSPRTALRFLDAVQCVLEELAFSPDRWAILIGDVRRAIVPRFPWIVVYRIGESTVTIVAFSHGKRRPQYWAGRLE